MWLKHCFRRNMTVLFLSSISSTLNIWKQEQPSGLCVCNRWSAYVSYLPPPPLFLHRREEEWEKTRVDNSNTPINIQPRLKSAFAVPSQINMAHDRYLVLLQFPLHLHWEVDRNYSSWMLKADVIPLISSGPRYTWDFPIFRPKGIGPSERAPYPHLVSSHKQQWKHSRPLMKIH